MGHGSCEPSPAARSGYTDLTAELVLLMYLTLADARDLQDRKLLSDEKENSKWHKWVSRKQNTRCYVILRSRRGEVRPAGGWGEGQIEETLKPGVKGG